MDLWIRNATVSLMPVSSSERQVIDAEGCLILPGLINAHDHLELNLFPRLGQGPYANASAWARDIYRPLDAPVKQHLAVPKAIRLSWGAIKNLLSGVTMVAHHNALHPILFHDEFPVRVVERFGWAHSLRFSPDWETRFRETPPGYPFVIHAAEGVDETARREIHKLSEAGALTPSTVLVHGVGVGEGELPLLTNSRTSLVWCPSSNYFTLGRSVNQAVLSSEIAIALGTDSAITGEGDLLDELRVARRFVDPDRLYAMVTTDAARILKLPNGHGRISHGGIADLVIMRDSGCTPAETLLSCYPQLVMVRGRVVLAASEFSRRWRRAPCFLQQLTVEGRGRYLCRSPIRTLLPATKRVLGEGPRVAGKAVAA
jgi:cytosine/adenosine deaminase-related metal-dependent hydrolase